MDPETLHVIETGGPAVIVLLLFVLIIGAKGKIWVFRWVMDALVKTLSEENIALKEEIRELKAREKLVQARDEREKLELWQMSRELARKLNDATLTGEQATRAAQSVLPSSLPVARASIWRERSRTRSRRK